MAAVSEGGGLYQVRAVRLHEYVVARMIRDGDGRPVKELLVLNRELLAEMLLGRVEDGSEAVKVHLRINGVVALRV